MKKRNLFFMIFVMKKCKCLLVALLCSSLLLGTSYAVNVSAANKARVDSVMNVVERDWGKDTIVNQIAKYEKFINAFSKARFKDNDQKEMIMYLVECFQKKVDYLKTQVKTQNQVISNVDWDRVKKEWLAWHNEERLKIGLSPYNYSETLNYTSLIRAQQIASEKREGGTTHARKTSDSNWNTNSIREWFSDLGVTVVYFSESNAYGSYNCKKTDCTQEIIDVLKKCFDRTLLDKNHYPAVVSTTYDQIGLGVAIGTLKNNKPYLRLTTHYAKDIK